MPFLIAENGPRAGTNYPLEGARLILGRHPECDIVIDVGAVSRHHAQLVRVADQYYVEDLKSRNGTYVNGSLLDGRHRLDEGDHIRVCDISFLFQPQLAPTGSLGSSGTVTPVLLEDSPENSSMIMSQLDVVSSGSSVAIASTPAAQLRALLEISHSLGGTIELDKVLPQVLDSLFKLFIQADRGFIILRDGQGKLVPRWSKLRRDDDRMIRISRTIVNQVVESKKAILSADASEDSRFQMSESIADFRLRSFMCAPLIDVEGNALGALQIDSLDHRHRFGPEDLQLLAGVASQAAIAIDNAQLHEQVVRQRLVERDLELAQEVQRGFLPERPPELPQYDLVDYYEPADMIGGDYYDYIQLPDGRVAVIVADVVGHGIAAALLTAKLSAAIRFCLATQSDPAAAVTKLNASLIDGNAEDRFITLVMIVLHPDSDEITVVNAGHMPPMLSREGTEPFDAGADAQGIPLLVFGDFKYPQTTITVKPGDNLLLYTDGLNEMMNPDGELYGIGRLRRQVAKQRDGRELTLRLIDDIREFAAGAAQKDDMCLVCCTRK